MAAHRVHCMKPTKRCLLTEVGLDGMCFWDTPEAFRMGLLLQALDLCCGHVALLMNIT